MEALKGRARYFWRHFRGERGFLNNDLVDRSTFDVRRAPLARSIAPGR